MTVLSRRSFLGALSVAAVSARPLVGAVQTARMETFSEWLAASRPDRASAAQACLERIRTMDPSIHAWVQVAPQPSLGDGSLAGISFGAKDIMETQGARDRVRIGDLQRAARVDGCGDRHVAQKAGRHPVRQNPHDGLRVPNPCADAQSPESRAHPRRQLQRLSGGGCGRHGSIRAWNADPRFDIEARVALRCHRIQAKLRRHLH